MSPTQPVLLLSNDPALAVALGTHLARHALKLQTVDGHRWLMHRMETGAAAGVVLDLDAVANTGIEVIKGICARAPSVLVVLVGSDDAVDRVIALEAGADDCLSKPVDARELATRIRVALRRVAQAHEAGRRAAGGSARLVRFGSMMLDRDAGMLLGPQGSRVPLTALELKMLDAFADHPCQVLDRDRLSELAHGRPWSPLDRSLDIRISRLRAKIEPDPDRPTVIVTVRGVGYRYDAER